MKIYTKVVINMETCQVVDSESYEYEGELALCWVPAAIMAGGMIGSSLLGGKGGGGGARYPGPSEQELELLELQLEALKRQGADAAALRPYILQSMGMKEDAEGNLTKMTEEEYYESLSTLDQKSFDVAMASAERSLKAYAGELEISPALEKSLGERKTELEENLSRNLGSGWQGTTAGIQAMAQFDETSELIREEVRSGIITNEGGMTLSSLDYMSGISDTSMSAFPSAQAGGIFSGAGQMAQQYRQDRQGQFQANAYNAQTRSQQRAGLMSGIGSLMGAGIGAYGQYRAYRG